MSDSFIRVWAFALTAIVLYFLFSFLFRSNQYPNCLLEPNEGPVSAISENPIPTPTIASDLLDGIKPINEVAPFKKLLEDSASDVATDKDKLVVAFFWAGWCGPCNSAKGDWKKLSTAWKEYGIFVSVDVDKSRELVELSKISGTPTWIIYYKGVEVGRQVGFSTDINKSYIIMKTVRRMIEQEDEIEEGNNDK